MPGVFEEPAVRVDGSAAAGLWVRRAILTVAALLPAVALLNVIGQQPSGSAVANGAARMTLSAPATVRGGLLFQSRIEIVAGRALEHPRLKLDDGWMEGMQISSIEPAAARESSSQGRVVLSYGRLDAGDRLVVWVQSQVDPTNPGRHPYGLTLQDATTDVARLDRTITILP